GQDDDRREEEHARPRLHRHQRLQLHEGDGESVHEDVEHRPAADELEPRARGCTDISGCSGTRQTVKVSTKTSSIDQRPMNSTMRYSRARSRLLRMERRCTVM